MQAGRKGCLAWLFPPLVNLQGAYYLPHVHLSYNRRLHTRCKKLLLNPFVGFESQVQQPVAQPEAGAQDQILQGAALEFVKEGHVAGREDKSVKCKLLERSLLNSYNEPL